MLSARIYTEDHEIDARLVSFNVTRQELIEVVRGVVAARADSVENDPVTAEGLLAYIYGTRFLRSLFRTKGWHLHRENNIESVSHPDREQRIIYQSVDLAASRQNPQAVSGKGTGSDKIIAEAQGTLFPEEEIAKITKSGRAPKFDLGVWYFCVSVNGDDDIRAELSLPTAVEGGNFKGFIERIYIVRDGEWPGLTPKAVDHEAAEFEPVVSRK